MWYFSILTLLFLVKLGEGKDNSNPSPSTSKSTANLISMRTGTIYIANNTKLEVECVIKGERFGLPNLKFYDDEDNTVLKNTSRLKIIIQKDTDNNVTTGTFLWDPVYVRDNVVKGVRCKNEGSGMDTKSFTLVVIPSVSIPTVTISNASEVNIRKGSTRKIICLVTCKNSNVVKGFSATWMVDSLTSSDNLPENTKSKFKFNKENSTVTSTLSITNANRENTRKYYCIARLKFTGYEKFREYYDEISVNVVEDSGLVSSEEEIIKKTGEDAKLDCEGTGIPKPKLKWWKKERNKNEVAMPSDDVDDMDSRYSYEISGKDKEESAPNSVFKIKDITTSDRSQYVCRVEFWDRNVTKVFTLRVRDPLGALWPFLGIVIEAILLVIIIRGFAAYDKKNPKKTNNLDEKDGVHTSETAPLVKNSKEDGARQRTSANEVSA